MRMSMSGVWGCQGDEATQRGGEGEGRQCGVRARVGKAAQWWGGWVTAQGDVRVVRAQVGDAARVPGWARWHDGVMAGWVSEGDMMVRCQARWRV